MVRVVLLLFAVFLFLVVLRGLRIFLAAVLGRPGSRAGVRPGGTREEEMVRDPVCGTWIDRRLALSGRRGEEIVAVCSPECRKALEAK
ncbi:MAG TPA: hypothetical protein VGL03_12280 [Thermoanaerobaculia bacterium]|jgi:hypothetical protein